jgi:hypothetical protein
MKDYSPHNCTAVARRLSELFLLSISLFFVSPYSRSFIVALAQHSLAGTRLSTTARARVTCGYDDRATLCTTLPTLIAPRRALYCHRDGVASKLTVPTHFGPISEETPLSPLSLEARLPIARRALWPQGRPHLRNMLSIPSAKPLLHH